MKRIIFISCLALFIVIFSILANQKHSHAQEVSITTWNLEHMMSKDNFAKWKSFCSRADVNWNEENAEKVGKQGDITYCTAHSGLKWKNNTIQESLPLRDFESFKKKVAMLKERAVQLNSDIFALQEVSDKAAIENIFSPEQYVAIFKERKNVAMNVGFAIKKSFAPHITTRLISELSICEGKDRVDGNPSNCRPGSYRTRPGLELVFTKDNSALHLLNVHLKSSCRSYPLNNLPGHASDRSLKGCQMLRDQVPVLEDWIDTRIRREELIIVVGDFNRNLVKEIEENMPARLDGTTADRPIAADTKIGSLFKELSDNEPQGAILEFEWQDIEGSEYRRCSNNEESYTVLNCHRRIDHFLFTKSFRRSQPGTPEKLFARGSHYGEDGYCSDNARPSDHCPLTMTISF